ncbi:MAG: hypothetical protein AB1515_10360 [Nitrospirota bacterium]
MSRRRSPTARRRERRDYALGLLIGLLLMGGFFLLVGCRLSATAAGEPPGTEYVVFVDLSQSIRLEDRKLFTEALTTQIIPTLQPGDRLLVAPITDRTLTGFRPLIDVTLPALPPFNGWTDNLLKHKQHVQAVEAQMPKLKEALTAQADSLFTRRENSAQTDILSSLLLTEKLFHNVAHRKVLVLMSDMIEDYAPHRFQKVAWTPDSTKALLDELERADRIPNLSGICVYVAGASAASPAQAEQIGAFWKAYFERANADMHMSRYAHVLLHWPPEAGCAF